MTATNISLIGTLILAVLVAAGGGIWKVLTWTHQPGPSGELVASLQERLEEVEKNAREERADRERDAERHREDLAMIRSEHKTEMAAANAQIERLQQEVRDLLRKLAAQ